MKKIGKMNFIFYFSFISLSLRQITYMDTVTNILNKGQKEKSQQEILAEKALEILKTKGKDALDAYIEEQTKLRKEQPAQEKETKQDIPEKIHPERIDVPTPASTKVPDIISSPASGTLAENIEKAISKAPVDKSVQTVSKPQTLRDAMMILYPKSAAFGSYKTTELAENILTLMHSHLQGYMSRSYSKLRPDIIGEISMRLDSSVLVGDDKSIIIKELNRMMERKFKFWWQNDKVPEGTKNIETTGVLISAIHNYIGTSYVDIVINKWALPFLLYYGPGVGASLVNPKTSLLLPGKYAKRLHRILSAYVDKGRFDYPIAKLKEEFDIPSGYSNGTIKRSIIAPAVKNINDFEENFSVEFEFTCQNSAASKTKNENDTVEFKIQPKKANRVYVAENIQSEYVRNTLPLFLDEPYSSGVKKFIGIWRNHGDLGLVYAKLKYYTEQANSGKMTIQKAKNFLIKAIETETHVILHTSRKKSIKDE